MDFLVSFWLEIEFLRLDTFVCYACCFRIGRLPNVSIIFKAYTSYAWIIFCDKSHNPVHCFVLYDFCVCPQCRRANQLVFIASSLGTTFEIVVRHLFNASSNIAHNSIFDKRANVLQRILSFSSIHRIICFLFRDISISSTCFWDANCKYL